jgi:hypothetical protein
MFWLELLVDAGIVDSDKLSSLRSEARELTALFTASQHTARSRS